MSTDDWVDLDGGAPDPDPEHEHERADPDDDPDDLDEEAGDDPDDPDAESDGEGPSLVLPTTTPEEREAAVTAAAQALQHGRLVVIPTDTVYGLAADAFDAAAVADLLDAKGRGREMPPPVLISSAGTVDALAVALPGYARALTEHFWPGPLTLVCRQQPSLKWDLGDTLGTVALRMPDHEIALQILERTGPLAVSSANLTGEPAATDAGQAEDMLGDEVEVIVDAGPVTGGGASTIIDVTGTQGRILREGVLSLAALNAVLEPLGASLVLERDQG